MRDLCNNLDFRYAIQPQTPFDTTAIVGRIIDHQDSDEAVYLIKYGALPYTSSQFTVLLEESDTASLTAQTMTGATTVADADMISNTSGVAPLTAAYVPYVNANEVRKIGYIGNKRYTRITITPVHLISAYSYLDVGVVLGLKHRLPIVQGTGITS